MVEQLCIERGRSIGFIYSDVLCYEQMPCILSIELEMGCVFEMHETQVMGPATLLALLFNKRENVIVFHTGLCDDA